MAEKDEKPVVSEAVERMRRIRQMIEAQRRRKIEQGR